MSGARMFLGIDGGGSRCRARIRDEAGKVLAESVGGAANIYQDLPGALQTIVGTAQTAAGEAGLPLERLHAGLGLAGLMTSASAERLESGALPFASVTADNDAYAACLGAFRGGDGGIVVAGTGSIGFGLVGGHSHMVGGWGFALGDHGSGAWVGHHAVRRAALAVDGLLQPTGLVEEILAAVGRTRFEISRWSEQAKPKDYAQFAPHVFRRAAVGDVQAMTIVIEGASAISSLGRALLARGVRQLCLFGGLSEVYPPYLDADIGAVLVEARGDAMDGAIMMARTAQGLPGDWL